MKRANFVSSSTTRMRTSGLEQLYEGPAGSAGRRRLTMKCHRVVLTLPSAGTQAVQVSVAPAFDSAGAILTCAPAAVLSCAAMIVNPTRRMDSPLGSRTRARHAHRHEELGEHGVSFATALALACHDTTWSVRQLWREGRLILVNRSHEPDSFCRAPSMIGKRTCARSTGSSQLLWS